MSKMQQTIQTYDNSALAMKQKFDSMKTRVVDVQRFFDFVENKQNPAVIEIGCGYGREAMEIMKYTKNYLGLDASKGMIELAKEKLPDLKWQIADLEQYDFPNDLDGVVAFASLLHSDKAALGKLFAQLQHKLVRGGVVYVSMKQGDYLDEGKWQEDTFGKRIFYYYQPKQFLEIAGEGWEKVYQDEQFFNGQNWFTLALRKIN